MFHTQVYCFFQGNVSKERLSISKLAIISFESKLVKNMKESLIVYSLVVRDCSIGTKNLASFYVGVPMADKLGLKDGRPPVAIFWTLAKQ